MVAEVEFRQLSIEQQEEILPLVKLLNADLDMDLLRERLQAMFALDYYHCFGLYRGQELVALSSVWLSTKLYSGKQAELDNVVVKESCRQQGLGQLLVKHMEKWAKSQGCLTVELASYVSNSASHKFYFNQGYHIIGYHFQKPLD